MELCGCGQANFDVLSRHALTQGSPNKIPLVRFAALALLGDLLRLREVVLIDLTVDGVGKTV